MFFWACGSLLGADQGFVGAQVCGKCHTLQHQRQSASRHARSLQPILRSPLAELLTARTFRERSGLSFEYKVVDQGLAVTVRKPEGRIAQLLEDKVSAILEWTFGAGAQGLTPVGRFENNYLEHRVSFYPRLNALALTQGHPLGDVRSSREGLGILQTPETAYGCFSCHATGVKRGAAGPDLSAMRPGVECERCHGPGAEHVASAGSPNLGAEKKIANPGRLDSAGVIEMCGECHRLPESAKVPLEPEKDDPFSVRFQPIGLLASRCFRESGTLSCLTCHPPTKTPAWTLGSTPPSVSFVIAARRQRKLSSAPARQSRIACPVTCAWPRPSLTFSSPTIESGSISVDFSVRLKGARSFRRQ